MPAVDNNVDKLHKSSFAKPSHDDEFWFSPGGPLVRKAINTLRSMNQGSCITEATLFEIGVSGLNVNNTILWASFAVKATRLKRALKRNSDGESGMDGGHVGTW